MGKGETGKRSKEGKTAMGEISEGKGEGREWEGGQQWKR